MNMKSTCMACCLLMLGCISSSAKDNKSEKTNKYKLVWQDHFKGKTFDSKSWSKIPRDRPDWKRHMSYDDRLYEVKDGTLILHGVNNDGSYKYDLNGDGKLEADTARFVTGGLYTKHKRTIEYGKVEVRAKLVRRREHGQLSGCCRIEISHGLMVEKSTSWSILTLIRWLIRPFIHIILIP